MRQNKIAILLWLYHTQLSKEFLDLLAPLKDHIDLYLGLCDSNNNIETICLFQDIFKNNLSIEYYPNQGADIAPFLYQLSYAFSRYKYIVKIHSKLSNWGFKNHVNWRTVLLHDLLYLPNFSSNLIQLSNNKIDMSGPKSLLLYNKEHTNTAKIIELSKLLNIDFHIKDKFFVGGNMFMARTEIFKPIMDNFDQVLSLIKDYSGKINDDSPGGTFCHALERVFGYIGSRHKKIGHPFNHTTIITTPKSLNHKVHMIELYNHSCYIQENLNIYGKILFKEKNNISIEWHNQDQPIVHNYYKYNNNKLINYAYI